ncbi:MAG: dockerin type I domain-containing protein, partial [Chthoniobacterales bacterium]
VVQINGVNGAADAPAINFDIPMSILIGDTNANRTVNAADVAQTKGRLGQAVNATNFRSDVNANGSINAADTAIIKQKSGTSLPP